MKSLLQFLLKNSIFLLFVLLEILSLTLIIHYNEYAQSATFSSANRIVATIYATQNTINDYFHLKKDNQELINENIALRNQIAQLQAIYDNTSIDTLITSQYSFIPAKVINLTTHQQKNYLTINKGSKDGVKPDMGVISKNGVVGIVSAVSKHYALIIPLLHPNFSLSCKLQQNGHAGTLQWDGRDYRYAQLKDIGGHIDITLGDTIVTSGLSVIFPEGIPVATIYKDELRENNAYHTIDVALCVDFRKLHNVCIIKNHDLLEIQQLQQNIQTAR